MVTEGSRTAGAVALFSPRFVPPTQTFVYEETKHYQRYQAEVFTRFRMNAEQFPFAPVHALASDSGPRHSVESFLYQTTTLSPTFARHLASRRFDLIHALFGRAGVNALPYHAAFDLPLIVTFRGHDGAVLSDRERFRPPNWPYWLLSKALFRRASRCLTVSSDLAERLLRAGADPDKVLVWHSGVEIPPPVERPSAGAQTVIVIVGRFVEKKGIEYGLQAFDELARERPGVHLRIVGDGPLRRRYEQMASQSGARERIVFLGMLSHARLREELAHADILFAPSVTPKTDVEGVPTVMMEANARGVPAVASRTGGLPDIVEHARTGLLVEERDVRGFVDALRLLTDDVDRRRAMGEAARSKMAREHNIVGRMGALEDIYDQVIWMHRTSRKSGLVFHRKRTLVR